jgi:indolepyruvate ferredoxin oxidoreductase beta subunit
MWAMEKFNIYLTGVGGQGIGLLSEIILRAVDHAGFSVKSVDTHGLAQRGGVVVSQIRIGTEIFTPLIPRGKADLVLSLERHEALRAVNIALKDNGTLVYYNTVWQPLPVRLGKAPEVLENDIRRVCRARGIRIIDAVDDSLTDYRMQNIVLLCAVDKEKLIPGVETGHYKKAMEDLMKGDLLEKNLTLFRSRTYSGNLH